MARRGFLFDTLNPAQARLPKRGSAAGRAHAEPIVPRCAVCGGYAAWGFREPGISHLRTPIEIWACFQHRSNGPRLLQNSLNAASAESASDDDLL